MMTFDESELKELFACYTVPEPPAALVARTKRHMYREMAAASAVPATRAHWILVLTGLTVVMTLCLFYTMTVGTILRFIVPADMVYYLKQSLVILTAAGTTFIAGMFMILALKYLTLSRYEHAVQTI